MNKLTNYYAEKLNAEKLTAVYDTALPRVAQYLRAEIDFVADHLSGGESLLELGCGYGRVLKELAGKAEKLCGVDISPDSIGLGRRYLAECPNVRLIAADAYALEFEGEFQVVICLQNGLSALKGEAPDLIKAALKSLAPGGRAFFSTYSPKFWDHRLAWFQEQADKKLLGEIDYEKSGDGLIICRDGFTGRTFTAGELAELGRGSGLPFEVKEVDDSSLFLILKP